MLATRLGIATLAGALVTASLLFIMQYLIATGRSALTETRDFHFVDFVRVEREETVSRKKPKPKKPPTPDQPPPDMPQPEQDAVNPEMGVIGVAPVATAALDVSVGGFGLAVADGDYLPIVKVAPVYPRRALSRGLEGHVIVEFTVTRTGTVRDPVVIESTNSVFERAALAACLKFKYKPRIVDGEPIEVAGVRNKITFVLED